MTDWLAFAELRVRRMPGFPSGGIGLEGLSPGVNLIRGPNASGKTTIARALQSLLWAGASSPGASVEGRFTLDGDEWLVDVDGDRVRWQRDGQDASAPSLPPADTRQRYHLSLEDLLVDRDQGLADRIRIESAGGYDVPTAAEGLAFGARGRPSRLIDRVRAARSARKEAQDEAAGLRAEREQLAELRRRRDALASVAARGPSLERALTLARAREARDEARRAHDAFPEALASLRGDEIERLEGWDQDAEGHRDTRAAAEAAVEKSTKAIEAAGLGSDGVDAAVLTELDEKVDAVRTLQQKEEAASEALAAARAARVQAGSSLGIDPQSSPPDLSGVDADRLDGLLRRAEGLRTRRASLDERIHQAKGGGETTGRRRDTLLWVGAVAVVLLGIGALILGLTDPAGGPRGTGMALAGGLAVVLGIALLLLRPREAADGRPAADPELERAEAELAEERATLASEIGLEPPQDDLSLHLLGTRLLAWDHARGTEAEAEARQREVRGRIAEILARSAEILAPFGEGAEDPDGLVAARDELRERRERHKDATRDLEAAREEIERAEAGLEKVEAERDALFEPLGLDGENREFDLRSLCRQLDEYAEARRELEGARRDHETAERALQELAEGGDAGAAELLADAADATPEDLERRLDEATEAAETAAEQGEEIAAIARGLEDARHKHDVEDSLTLEQAARAALEDRRALDIDAAVGDALASWVRSRASDHNRPAVFHRARQLLIEITRGRYELRMDDGDSADFRAWDTSTGRGYALEELSAGTRLQLLLAVRIAFVETQESGAALPLLLDEVLANCDDHRARAIIDAAVALARSGRQIFYFSAQADELAKWREALETADVDWAELGLGSPESDGPAFDWAGRLVHADEPLVVPPFDLWAEDVGGLHLSYLLEEPDTLEAVLGLGISTWGQLDTYARSAGEDAPDAVARAVAAARGPAAVCRKFGELRRRGGGRPVDRAVLLASGAVSDTFIDRVADLSDDLDGSGSALVDALAGLRGFRSAKLAELRAWFLECGYMSEEDVLDDAEVLLRLTAEAHRLAPELDPADVEALVARLADGPAPVAGERS